TLQTTAGTSQVDSIGVNANTTLTVSGAVQDPTPLPVPVATLTKVGTGTLVFPNANPYGGKTFVNAGILNVRNSGSLGTSGPETQTITVNEVGTIGTFVLSFNGVSTSPLAYNATGTQIAAALNNLSSILNVGGSVAVTLLGTSQTTTPPTFNA